MNASHVRLRDLATAKSLVRLTQPAAGIISHIKGLALNNPNYIKVNLFTCDVIGIPPRGVSEGALPLSIYVNSAGPSILNSSKTP